MLIYNRADSLIVRHDEIVLEAGGKQFIFTENMITEHFNEGWSDSETTLHTVDDVSLELKQQDWKTMRRLLNPFG